MYISGGRVHLKVPQKVNEGQIQERTYVNTVKDWVRNSLSCSVKKTRGDYLVGGFGDDSSKDLWNYPMETLRKSPIRSLGRDPVRL